MQRKSERTDQVHSWEQELRDAISQVESISHHEKNVLQLYLETHPLPFQPSPVLLQLLQNDRQRRSCSALVPSTKQRKQQLKSADYLDRKFESEIRQHYELENAQNCGRWKQFHLQASEARQQLTAGIERDFRQFCQHLGVIPGEKSQPNEEQGYTQDNQQSEFSPTLALPSGTTCTKNVVSVEGSLRLHLAQEWVHQERFNIQEAFTNQTKKLQEDLDIFLHQQEVNFLDERHKVLNVSSVQSMPPTDGMLRNNRAKTSSKFQSSTKRGMLLQTASALQVEPNGETQVRQIQWNGMANGSRVHSNSRHIRSDVDETQEELDELERRLKIRKEAVETKRKDGMQWIGRQCAHLFAQLDCKETEARVIALLTEEEISQLAALRQRVSEIVNCIKGLSKEHRGKENGLPLLPRPCSRKRLPKQQLKDAYKPLKASVQLNRK